MVDMITKIFAVWDPMELIEMGASENEYHPEASKVSEYIDNDNPNVDSLARYIRQTFITYFEMVLELDVCEMVASCILKNLEEE